MELFLQDPNMQVLGQLRYTRLCVFGTDSKSLTLWLQRMAWLKFPMYRDELYELHKSYHQKQKLNETQGVFLKFVCEKSEELRPLCLIFNENSTNAA